MSDENLTAGHADELDQLICTQWLVFTNQVPEAAQCHADAMAFKKACLTVAQAAIAADPEKALLKATVEQRDAEIKTLLALGKANPEKAKLEAEVNEVSVATLKHLVTCLMRFLSDEKLAALNALMAREDVTAQQVDQCLARNESSKERCPYPNCREGRVISWDGFGYNITMVCPFCAGTGVRPKSGKSEFQETCQSCGEPLNQGSGNFCFQAADHTPSPESVRGNESVAREIAKRISNCYAGNPKDFVNDASIIIQDGCKKPKPKPKRTR